MLFSFGVMWVLGALCTFSSSRTQGIQRGSPKLMAPRIGTETFKPELPRRLYSTLVSAADFATESSDIVS